MTKRATGRFARYEDDWYPTPPKAAEPLLRYMLNHKGIRFYEPCAGDGSLAKILVDDGMICMGMSDRTPRADMVRELDAFDVTSSHYGNANCFITNPPWDRPTMHRLIEHLAGMLPTFMLLESDWLFTKQAIPFLKYATAIVAVGRVRWIEGSAHDGFDNCCWVLFNRHAAKRRPVFIARRD